MLAAITPLLSCFVLPGATIPARGPPAVLRHRGGAAPLMSDAIAIIVDVEIQPERLDEFLEVMKVDAEGSRTEEGCLRFDFLQDQENPNRFFFYEVGSFGAPSHVVRRKAGRDTCPPRLQVYVSADAVAYTGSSSSLKSTFASKRKKSSSTLSMSRKSVIVE